MGSQAGRDLADRSSQLPPVTDEKTEAQRRLTRVQARAASFLESPARRFSPLCRSPRSGPSPARGRDTQADPGLLLSRPAQFLARCPFRSPWQEGGTLRLSCLSPPSSNVTPASSSLQLASPPRNGFWNSFSAARRDQLQCENTQNEEVGGTGPHVRRSNFGRSSHQLHSPGNKAPLGRSLAV